MDNLPINVTDIVLGGVLLISALLAYARGFVHEVLSVAGWIGAIFAAVYGLPYAKPYARDLIPHELAADVAAGVVIFLVTLIVLSLLTRAVAGMVKASALNMLDRSLGFLFGLVRGAVVVCVAYLALSWMIPPEEQPSWITGARSMPLVERGADLLRQLVPESAGQAADEARKKAEKAVEAQRVLGDLMKTEPKGTQKADSGGYGETDRRRMEQLIQGTQ